MIDQINCSRLKTEFVHSFCSYKQFPDGGNRPEREPGPEPEQESLLNYGPELWILFKQIIDLMWFSVQQ